MKRLISILLICALLMGCGQRVISPVSDNQVTAAESTATPSPTAAISQPPATPGPTITPRPVLATFAPVGEQPSLFSEQLLSSDGEPIASLIRSLLMSEGLSKAEYCDRLLSCIQQVEQLDKNLLDLRDRGRTLTADRRGSTVEALQYLMSDEVLDALRVAYDGCPGAGEALPLDAYAASMNALAQDTAKMEERTVPFFSLDGAAAGEYRAALARYMGEPIVPRTLFNDLEELAQTEAYAIAAALQADPEAARKKEPISFGGYAQNISFLCKITEALCPLPDGSKLPVPSAGAGAEDRDLLTLAFQTYPGMAFLRLYADRSSPEQQARWASAPEGYLAVHCAYAVVPYLSEFGLDYVQYKWYEDMLDVTLTGISALLIHYYGYSEKDLAEYLKGWGAESFAGYLYDKAMDDPFDSLVASYGYIRYLHICQAALNAGCESEQRFLQDYLAAGPAPFEALKEYMVGLYQNKVDKP